MPDRNLTQVDKDIKLAAADRRRYMNQIETHLRAIAELRTSYARAGGRIDDFLDERSLLVAAQPPT